MTNRGDPSTKDLLMRGMSARNIRLLVALVAIGAGGIAAGEVVARLVLGLGDPPLMRADPEIEYLFLPDQLCERFGNVVAYNHFSMRNLDNPPHGTSQRVVLVIGDSVVNGGALTDQGQLATSLLERRLGPDTFVGNISAGSWGPPNMYAYIRRYGSFHAQEAIIVLSSHDAWDVPDFKPTVGVNPDFPDRPPLFALQELSGRYLLRYLGFAKGAVAEQSDVLAQESRKQGSLAALASLIALLKKENVRVIVAQHQERPEVLAKPKDGHALIGETSARSGAQVVQLGPGFSASLKRGEDPYRDDIHPNEVGQRLIADALFAALGQPAVKGLDELSGDKRVAGP